jgi:hypothetical protein
VQETGGKKGSEKSVHEPVTRNGSERGKGLVDDLDTEMHPVAARHGNACLGEALTQTSFDGGAGVGIHGSSSIA